MGLLSGSQARNHKKVSGPEVNNSGGCIELDRIFLQYY